MNWNVAGAIGEVVGAAAVVISVMYLAVQIRKQTEEYRLSATREIAAQFMDGLKVPIADEGLCEIYLKGIQNYKSLPEAKRLRISLLFQHQIRVMELQYFHSKKRNIDASFLDSINRTLSEILSFPGVQQWWETTHYSFEDGFQQHIEHLLSESKTKSYPSTFSTKKKAQTNSVGEFDT